MTAAGQWDHPPREGMRRSTAELRAVRAEAGTALPSPKMKIVISVADGAWSGTIYPTQSIKGGRRTFSTPAELLHAVALLTGWDSSCDGSRAAGQETAGDDGGNVTATAP